MHPLTFTVQVFANVAPVSVSSAVKLPVATLAFGAEIEFSVGEGPPSDTTAGCPANAVPPPNPAGGSASASGSPATDGCPT